MNEKIKLSIIIPAFNEEKRISATLESIDQYFRDKLYRYEIIVVANRCTDNTVDLVKSFKTRCKNLELIDLGPRGGKGLAVKVGMKAAKGEYLMFMDADNSVPIEEIEKFWPSFNKGYDVVIGSRYINGSRVINPQPWYRYVLGRVANLVVHLILLPNIKDSQCGFKVFKKDAAKFIFGKQETYKWGFDSEILVLAKKYNYSIKEQSITWSHMEGSQLRPIKAILPTIKELIQIKINLITHKY